MTEDHAAHRVWWQHGLLSAGAGLVFATMLTLALVMLSTLRVTPVLALKRAGIDMSMRVYAAFPRLLGNITDGEGRTYVFFDIDEAACRRVAGNVQCGAREPVPPELVAQLVSEVAKAPDGPRVLVIDVKPPEAEAARELWRRALAREDGPWIVLPVESRPSGELANIQADTTGAFMPGRAAFRARAAAVSTFTDPEAGDGVLRHYPALVRLRGEDALLPSMPFVAAALSEVPSARAAANARALDCSYYPASARDCPADPLPVQIGKRTFRVPSLSRHIAEIADSASPLQRIFYSLPSLAGGAEEKLADQYRGVYDLYPVSMLIGADGTVRIPPGLLHNAVVVIGSSNAAVHDWHATPLGAMTGAEIVLNAVRSVAEFAQQPESDGEAAILSKATWRELIERLQPVILVGTLVLGPAWLAIAFVAVRTRERPWLRSVGALLCGGIFLSALTIGLAVEVGLHAEELQESTEAGRVVDLFTPLLGLGLEGFADASVVLLGFIHSWLAAVAGLVVRGLGRI